MNTSSSAGPVPEAVRAPSSAPKADPERVVAAPPAPDTVDMPPQGRPHLDDTPGNAPYVAHAAPDTAPHGRRHHARRAVRAVRVFASTAVKIGLLGRDAEL